MPNMFLNSPLVKVSVRYGAVTGLLCMGFVISMFYFGKHPFLMNPMLDFRVPVFALMIFFSLKEVRDYYQGGILNFWQGMIGSFVFTFTLACLCGLTLMIFSAWEPDFVTTFISSALEQVKAFPPEEVERVGRQTYEQGLAELKKVDGYFMAKRYFFQSFIISFFISAIISVILRRQPQTPQ